MAVASNPLRMMVSPQDAYLPENHSLECLKASLAGCDTCELWVLASRLTHNHGCLKSTLQDLQAERHLLQEDNAGLRSTIQCMISHLRLKVTARVVPEPRLAEGSLDFVGRFWERVRPRTSVVLVNEHIGEIRRNGSVQQVDGLPIEQQWTHLVAERLTGAWGFPFYQVNETETLVDAGRKDRLPHVKRKKEERVVLDEFCEADGGNNLPCTLKSDHAFLKNVLTFFGIQFDHVRASAAPSSQSSSPGLKAKTSIVGHVMMVAFPSQQTLQENRDSVMDHGTSFTEKDGSSVQIPSAGVGGDGQTNFRACQMPEPMMSTAASSPPKVPAEGNAIQQESAQHEVDKEFSSVLIEAHLKLDGVSLAVCRVRATDRCREVAEYFVDEHCLKPAFKAPLVAYLRKAEEDAVVFPVMLEADLMDIRIQYGSNAA